MKRKALNIAISGCAIAMISCSAYAAPVNDAGGDWVCQAGGDRLIAYSYPYDGNDFNRALIHLEPYAKPTEQGYSVTKESEMRVSGYTGDGTPFVCEIPAKKKKKK